MRPTTPSMLPEEKPMCIGAGVVSFGFFETGPAPLKPLHRNAGPRPFAVLVPSTPVNDTCLPRRRVSHVLPQSDMPKFGRSDKKKAGRKQNKTKMSLEEEQDVL